MDTAKESGVGAPQKLLPQDVHGLKYFQPMLKLLERLHSDADHPNRTLHYDQYAALLLLSYFNPLLQGLRELQAASDLKKVRKELGVPHAPLGSLSEAARVFDPQLLREIFLELAAQVTIRNGLARPQGVPLELVLTALDGTVLAALPKMLWALWLGRHEQGVKLHFQFDILRSVPVDVALTPGNGNEKETLKALLRACCLYLLDRGYRDYALFQAIIDAQSSFVARVQNNVDYEVIETRPLSAEALAAGVKSDQVVWLGGEKSRQSLRQPVRLIHVHVKNPPAHGLKGRLACVDGKVKPMRTSKDEYDVWLVTDRLDLTAEMVALLYRYRWQIELFFRWFKCVLGCKHLLSESPNGIAIQVYAALIATLLIMLWTQRKPNRMTLTMVGLYLQGWADEEELMAYLKRLPSAQKASA
jgi:hypothetical protein